MDWIKVTPETMPPECEVVLVTIELKYYFEKKMCREVDAAIYNPGGGYLCGEWDTLNDWDEGKQNIAVTHWMPFPKPAEIEGIDKIGVPNIRYGDVGYTEVVNHYMPHPDQTEED